MDNNWITIKTDEDLPQEGIYVLAKHNLGTWHDSDDQNNVNCVVVKLEKGKDMTNPNVGDSISSCDKSSNNQRCYGWSVFGDDYFMGQEIVAWMPIPDYLT